MDTVFLCHQIRSLDQKQFIDAATLAAGRNPASGADEGGRRGDSRDSGHLLEQGLGKGSGPAGEGRRVPRPDVEMDQGLLAVLSL
jgi:hypothetical protein